MSVYTSYLQQFERDFTLFLTSRSLEMIPGGYMVLTMIGNDKNFLSGNHSYTIFELLGITLNDMVQEVHHSSLLIPYPYKEHKNDILDMLFF